MFFNLKKEFEHGSLGSILAPVSLVLVLAAYPIVTYKYLKKNQEKIIDPSDDDEVYLRHKSFVKDYVLNDEVFVRNMRIAMIVHYRRLAYSFIMVFCYHIIAIQIGMVMMISVFMMIMILHYRPFVSRQENFSEASNECIIILVLYHMICLTDFVPVNHIQTRKIIGYSDIAVLLFTILYFILSIVIYFVGIMIGFLKKKCYKRKFEGNQRKMIIQLNNYTAQIDQEIVDIEAELADLMKTGYYFHSTKQERVKMLHERKNVLQQMIKPYKERIENIAKDKFMKQTEARAERRDEWLEEGIPQRIVNEMDQEFDN